MDAATKEILIAKVISDTWKDCSWAESIEECDAIIEAGKKKVEALKGVQVSNTFILPPQKVIIDGKVLSRTIIL